MINIDCRAAQYKKRRSSQSNTCHFQVEWVKFQTPAILQRETSQKQSAPPVFRRAGHKQHSLQACGTHFWQICWLDYHPTANLWTATLDLVQIPLPLDPCWKQNCHQKQYSSSACTYTPSSRVVSYNKVRKHSAMVSTKTGFMHLNKHGCWGKFWLRSPEFWPSGRAWMQSPTQSASDTTQFFCSRW